jgi:hypothetical protein
VQVRFDVTRNAQELLVSGDATFRGLALLQDLLSFFLVLPEVRLRGALFQFG